jgi:hypothetical protein
MSALEEVTKDSEQTNAPDESRVFAAPVLQLPKVLL